MQLENYSGKQLTSKIHHPKQEQNAILQWNEVTEHELIPRASNTDVLSHLFVSLKDTDDSPLVSVWDIAGFETPV